MHIKIVKDHFVFHTSTPQKIQALFPEAKVAPYGQHHICAVPHTLDTARVLKNLKRDWEIESPIRTRFDWPGKYRPFPHQITTAEFLTLHRRAFCLNGMGCIEGDAVVSTSRRGKTVKLTLRELYQKWAAPPTNSLGNAHWQCRSLKGGQFGLNKIEDVLYRGELPTLRITLADGKTFRCTPDHHIARPDGSWTAAGQLLVGDSLVTNGKKMAEVVCRRCGRPRLVDYYNRVRAETKVCRTCKGQLHGQRVSGTGSPTWRGGKPYIDKDGYVRCFAPDHPRAGRLGRVYEHILVMEKILGRHITPNEQVHHKNHCRSDNRLENLELMPAGAHHKIHSSAKRLDGARTINGGKMVFVPKQSQIVAIEDGGVVDVYDLCMGAPHHNFVVNGVVVHNSGKTASTIWCVEFLMRQRDINRCLIVAPLSTLERVWADELFRLLPLRRVAVLHGSRDKRIRLLAEPHDFYIINHDGLQIIADELKDRPDINHILIDEVAAFRNARTSRFKTANEIVNRQHPRSCWGLTGTPTPNEPTDAYAQMKLICPENYRGSFKSFKEQTMLQVNTFRWIPRKGSEEIVNSVLKPSIRYALEDCIELPPTIYQDRVCELSTEQRRHYKDLIDHSVTEVNGTEVTAVNAAVLLGKIVQSAVGVIYGTDGSFLRLDFGPRLSLLTEVIEECNEKVIVFVPLTGALMAIEEELKKYWSVAVVDGSTSSGKRNQIFSDFQHGPDPRILLANPGTMAHGLTLTAATTIIWYAPTTSCDIYNQANARIARPGQTKTTNIVNIYATPTEKRLYDAIKEKTRLQDVVLGLARKSN